MVEKLRDSVGTLGSARVEIYIWGILFQELEVLVRLGSPVEDDNAAEDAVLGPVANNIGCAIGVDISIEIGVVVEDAGTRRDGSPFLFRLEPTRSWHDPLGDGLDVALVHAELKLVEQRAKLVDGHSDELNQARVE